MKKLTSVVAMLMIVSTSAFAQFANSGASKSTSSASINGWQGVTVSYNMGALTYDMDGAKDTDLNGFSIGYVKAFSISKSLPLFVETGLKFSYATGEESYDNNWYWEGDADIDEEKYEYTYYELQVPINLAYEFAVNEDIQVLPYTGLYLKYNVAAEVDYSWREGYYTPNYSNIDEGGNSIDLFDDKDIKETWNRFNFGWQIGAKVAYKNFTAGLSYGLDLNEIGEKTKMNNFSISVGYNF